MKDIPKKEKAVWQTCIVMILPLLTGIICGILFAKYDSKTNLERSFGEGLLIFAVWLAFIYIAMYIQTIIHEAGHLVFGLFTGYRFSSFRIANFIWIKENDKLSFKRLFISGTAGQCLLTPPEMIDGKIPVVLYNLGGSLMNVIASFIFLGLYFLFGGSPLFSMIMLMLAAVGFCIAVINGVPMRLGMIDNDGYNAFSLRKNNEALRAFWLQLKINEQLAKRIRLKEMPKEWFVIPSDEAMENNMIAAIGVFACNRLMDEHKFEEAYNLMGRLLEANTAIIGLHRNLLVCDCIYCELISENRQANLDKMLTKELKKFIKSMGKYPSVLRMKYAYALLAERDNTKAEILKKEFNKCAKTYPYFSDIEAEKELIEIADKKCFERV